MKKYQTLFLGLMVFVILSAFFILALMRLRGAIVLSWLYIGMVLYLPIIVALLLASYGALKAYRSSFIKNKHGRFKPYDAVIDQGAIAYQHEPGLLLKNNNIWLILYPDGGEVFVSHPENLIRYQ